MPIVATFFGITIRMYYDEHDPPHFHAEYQGRKALIDFCGNVLRGNLGSRTALRLVRDWIDLRAGELYENWESLRSGKEVKRVAPLE
jgi:hypothetical protein